ncbi:MAG: 4-hydroxythreonine-4-phosphate dehydrogenase PdxA [Verrucomicrobiota bacterium]
MPKIGITLGDPAGIGPEIVAAAVARLQQEAFPAELCVIGTTEASRPGFPTGATANLALQFLRDAVAALRNETLDAVVTGPVGKKNLQEIGFPFPGQTEFFADACGRPPEDATMILSGPQLTVGLATIHVPLREVPTLLDASKIERTGRHLLEFCQRLGKVSPKIAVAGLNPHASEEGAFGDEEERLVKPALAALQATHPGIFSGPFPPDTVFHRAHQGHFDAVVCLYHDQGLIPLKLLDFDEAVNVTWGLPLVRTSPDHGTAYDLAGRGLAKPDSLLAAVRLARRLLN